MAHAVSGDLDNSHHTTKLIQCVQSGSLSDLKSLMNDEVDLHTVDHAGSSLIHHAVTNPNTDVLVHLLAAGPSVDSKGEMGATPLLHCAAKGTLENLRVLVDKGANVKSNDHDGKNAIHYAVRNTNAAAIIEFLLDQGLSIEALDDFGRTPLHHCAQYGTLQTIKILIGKGASIKSRSVTDMTTLHFAALNEKTSEITDFLVAESMPTEAKDGRTLTALHLSIIHTNLHNTEVLVEKGAKLEAKAKNGITSMQMAASYGDTIEALQFLLEKGALIKSRDVNGRAPLLTCAAEGNLEKMKFLIEKGADIQERDNEGVSALHFAATNEKTTDMIQFLLDEGMSLELRDKFGRTPLLFAASDGSLKSFEFLVEKGADVRAVTTNGSTTFHLAMMNDDHRGPLIGYIMSKPDDEKPDMSRCPRFTSLIPQIPANKKMLQEYGSRSYRYDEGRVGMSMMDSLIAMHNQ